MCWGNCCRCIKGIWKTFTKCSSFNRRRAKQLIKCSSRMDLYRLSPRTCSTKEHTWSIWIEEGDRQWNRQRLSLLHSIAEYRIHLGVEKVRHSLRWSIDQCDEFEHSCIRFILSADIPYQFINYYPIHPIFVSSSNQSDILFIKILLLSKNFSHLIYFFVFQNSF